MKSKTAGGVGGTILYYKQCSVKNLVSAHTVLHTCDCLQGEFLEEMPEFFTTPVPLPLVPPTGLGLCARGLSNSLRPLERFAHSTGGVTDMCLYGS